MGNQTAAVCHIANEWSDTAKRVNIENCEQEVYTTKSSHPFVNQSAVVAARFLNLFSLAGARDILVAVN